MLPSLLQTSNKETFFKMEVDLPKNVSMENVLNKQFVQLKETVNDILKCKSTVSVNCFIAT